MSSFIDLTGRRFGRLNVLEYDGKDGKHHMWICKCDCGNVTKTRGTRLMDGNTKSCGCLRNDKLNTHGMRKTRLYNIWFSMKKRCNNPNDKYYNNYGGRGIKVCDEWIQSFIAFYGWSKANGYNDSLTLDRINNDGNYEPQNCRWVTMKTQSNNRRSSKFIEYNGVSMTVAQWADYLNVKQATINKRLALQWPIDEALGITPHRKHKLSNKYDILVGWKIKSLTDCAKDLGIKSDDAYYFIRKHGLDGFISEYIKMTNKNNGSV